MRFSLLVFALKVFVSHSLINSCSTSKLLFHNIKPLQALNPQSEERYKLLQKEYESIKMEYGNDSNEIIEEKKRKIVIIKKCFEV